MMLGTGFVREVPSWLEWARDISIMGVTADLAMYLEFKDVNAKYGTKEEIFEVTITTFSFPLSVHIPDDCTNTRLFFR